VDLVTTGPLTYRLWRRDRLMGYSAAILASPASASATGRYVFPQRIVGHANAGFRQSNRRRFPGSHLDEFQQGLWIGHHKHDRKNGWKMPVEPRLACGWTFGAGMAYVPAGSSGRLRPEETPGIFTVFQS
jgi:hypothetical protein